MRFSTSINWIINMIKVPIFISDIPMDVDSGTSVPPELGDLPSTSGQNTSTERLRLSSKSNFVYSTLIFSPKCN